MDQHQPHSNQNHSNPIWHPCSQMKDYEIFKPLPVAKANGSYFELVDGKKVIDAISSWWCKSLGHSHPRLKKALWNQIEQFEHVILANTTNEIILKLSEKLIKLTESLDKVFYAGDGSCAIEIAMKMSIHARSILGQQQRIKFIALRNGYHGETIGALSVSDVGIYREPYHSMLIDTLCIPTIPYLNNMNDPLWQDCSEYWLNIESYLVPYANTATAIIVEPIVQGAGGMKIYSQDFLKRLRAWTKKHGIHLIADEIMTGIGRTGRMLACEHAAIEPDFLCLGKGLTSGWLPFSTVLTSNEIYKLFYDDYNKGKSFLHSHTYSGNPMGASIALEVLTIMEEENILNNAMSLGNIMAFEMNRIANATGKLTNIRHIGAMVAADLNCHDNSDRRIGFEVYQQAVKLGAMLRPLGNTIYWLPPLNTREKTIFELSNITQKAIEAINF